MRSSRAGPWGSDLRFGDSEFFPEMLKEPPVRCHFLLVKWSHAAHGGFLKNWIEGVAKMIILKLRSAFATVTCGVLAIHVSGCMVSPLDGDKNPQSNPVQFFGGTLAPNELVKIQAWHPRKGWTTIGETRSSRVPYSKRFYGETYYLFSKPVVVSKEFWRPTSDMFEEQAEVRCVIDGPGGTTKTVYGFKQNLWASMANPGFDQIDVLDFSLNGPSVTIYSPTPIGP